MPRRNQKFSPWTWLLGKTSPEDQGPGTKQRDNERIRAEYGLPLTEGRILSPANRRRKVHGQRRHSLKLMLCPAVALLTWAILPGTVIDRSFFALTSRCFTKPPFFITGKGSHESPHTLRTPNKQAAPPSDPLLDIAITDDPDLIFQTSPPSPVDFAIILKNLQRLGSKSVAIGMPLAWPSPDVISLVALDRQLDALSSVVTAAPLSRSPVPSPLPPAFRRASVPVSEIHGNTRNLPLVNRVSVPDAVLGKTTSWAGFTALESEPDSGSTHLLARWEDRVVFSFHLLAALADLGGTPSQIEVHMGRYISLGKDGPYIPIDSFGRITIKPSAKNESASIPAEKLLDAPADFLTGQRAGTVLIRNSMSAADEVSLRFSDSLVPTVSLIANPSGTTTSHTFTRIPWISEILLIGSFISVIVGLGNFQKTSGRLALVGLAGLLLILHLAIFLTTNTSLPILPALAAVWVAIPFTVKRRSVYAKSEAQPSPVPIG